MDDEQNLVEKFKKNFINVSEDDGSAYGDRYLNKVEFQIRINRTVQIFDKMIKNISLTLVYDHLRINDLETLRHHLPTIDTNLTNPTSDRATHLLLRTLNKSTLADHLLELLERIPTGASKEFLALIIELRRWALDKLGLTARKEMAKERILHKMFKRNEQLALKNSSIESKLIDKKDSNRVKLEKKEAVVEHLLANIAKAKAENGADVSECLRESDDQMTQFCQDHEGSQRSLMDRAERANDLFLNTRCRNWRQEQILREKQAQVTHNLKTWLAKYDIDMTEKTQELNEQTDTWNAALAKFTDWKTNKFDQQTLEYERLMQEKADDEKRAQHEQMMIFMMNRSARIIQRCWREYMARKKKAKGKSKGKGKKK